MTTLMIFSSPKALDYLIKHRFVYTLRKKKKDNDKVWIAEKRGGIKICDAEREYIGPVLIGGVRSCVMIKKKRPIAVSLLEFVKHSGFRSLKEWFEEVKKLNGGQIPTELYLYRVKRCSDTPSS